MKKAKKSSSKADPTAMPVMASEPMKKIEDGSEDDYEARHALDEILRAEGHKKNPAMMKRVVKHAERKHKEMRSIADLKHAYNDLDKDGV